MRYESRGDWIYATLDGRWGEHVCRRVSVHLDGDRVIVRRGKHSVSMPRSWLTGDARRLVAALDAIGAEPRPYPATAVHLRAYVRQLLEASGQGSFSNVTTDAPHDSFDALPTVATRWDESQKPIDRGLRGYDHT